MITKSCKYCSEKFNVTPARKDTAKFCSYSCSAQHRAKIRMQDPQFISKLVAAAHTPEANKNRANARRKVSSKLVKTCVICSNAFKVFPSEIDKYSCCSIKCGRKFQDKKVELTCHNCKKIYKRRKSAAKKSRFCSHACSTAWHLKNVHTHRTAIEVKVANLLKEIKVYAEEQKAIPNCKCIPDFFIPSTNTCIFCDGDYWHSFPRRQYCDARINKRLEKQGYKVLRFWEHDIHNNIELIREKITSATV